MGKKRNTMSQSVRKPMGRRQLNTRGHPRYRYRQMQVNLDISFVYTKIAFDESTLIYKYTHVYIYDTQALTQILYMIKITNTPHILIKEK